MSPSGELLYVIHSVLGGPTTVGVVRTADNSTAGQIQLANYAGGDVALSPNGTRLYVATDVGVTVINTFVQAIVTDVPVADRPTGIAVTPDDTRLYVTSQNSNTVSVIDTATNTVIKTITVGTTPYYGVAFTPDGRRAYVTNFTSSTGARHGFGHRHRPNQCHVPHRHRHRDYRSRAIRCGDEPGRQRRVRHQRIGFAVGDRDRHQHRHQGGRTRAPPTPSTSR